MPHSQTKCTDKCTRASLDAGLDFRAEYPGYDVFARLSSEIIAEALGIIRNKTQKAQGEEGERVLRDHPNRERE